MKIERLAISDVILITPKNFRDERGFFSETWNEQTFSSAGIDLKFVQDNHALSRSTGTVRGLHFQLPQKRKINLSAAPEVPFSTLRSIFAGLHRRLGST